MVGMKSALLMTVVTYEEHDCASSSVMHAGQATATHVAPLNSGVSLSLHGAAGAARRAPSCQTRSNAPSD
jgi:hypothetical protein